MENKDKNTWLQLTSVGVQIGVVMYLMAWAGRWCDAHYDAESSWFTLGFTIVGMLISIFFLYELVKNTNK
ncbi:AtpZ/AtpI family protein [Ornithobacterium rhinotracheale]|uniref:AtpZ/AtpI family protein n=1 Tax=Ornithobacterium rhinotracheale TaxID=28251 RepID=UPI001FF12BB0|nr:AtpZ/AtpI family protein [Ornithobacterium rhinotracheale]MCK0202492.1 AtpZ/AtpI family protein [Ornithobacterium rhinotracheale]